MYWAVNDAFTLIGRNVRHSVRSVDALLTAVMLPVLILLLFVYVFGGAIQTGGDYVDYVVPGIILLCAGFGSATTAVAVCQDMTNGVIDRFRSLPIAGASVLTGHVVASVLRNVASTAIPPAHHASATTASPPAEPPISSARTVSVIGVIGWWRAIASSAPGIVAGGTNALLT